MALENSDLSICTGKNRAKTIKRDTNKTRTMSMKEIG